MNIISKATPKKLVILDDELAMISTLRRLFHQCDQSYTIFGFTTFRDAIAELKNGDCYAFITDISMPKIRGDQVVELLSPRYPQLPCIVITGHPDKEVIQRIARAGNTLEVFLKPLKIQTLIQTLDDLNQHQTAASFEPAEASTNER